MDNTRRLSDSEIVELLREYRTNGRLDIRDRIVAQYTNLVESVARRFAGAAEPAEDLVQEGYIGLLTAVEGYNAEKGVKFSTYATHFIIGQIKHHLRDRGKIIKEPAWLQELNQKVTRVIETLAQELGRVPTNGEVANLVGMTEEGVAELLTTREVFKVASLDGTDNDDESPAAYDAERVRPSLGAAFQLPVEDKLVLEAALRKLKQLEQTVVHEFYFRERSQTEIARSLGISCNYVSHILRNSTRKLKRIMVTDDLREAHLEMALVRRRREESTRRTEDQSVTDSVTRLYNRHYFDSRLDEEIIRASRLQYAVALLLVRLGGMEQLCRAYGTARADDAMAHSAGLVHRSVRRLDIVTRFDSNTFALILPHTGPQVQVVADRLRRVVGAWIEEVGLDRGRAPLKLSIGCTSYPMEAGTARDLLAAAEAGLHDDVVPRPEARTNPQQMAA